MEGASANLPHPSFTLDLCRHPMAGAAYFTATAARHLDHSQTGGFRVRDFDTAELDALGLRVEMSEYHGSPPAHLLLEDGDGALAWLQLFGGEERGSQRHMSLNVAARDAGAAQALSDRLHEALASHGQGLNLCTLITTNEPIERLHPAVRRPGRCLAQVEVPPLDPETANRWLEGRGAGTPVEAPITLAELFAQTESRVEAGTRG